MKTKMRAGKMFEMERYATWPLMMVFDAYNSLHVYPTHLLDSWIPLLAMRSKSKLRLDLDVGHRVHSCDVYSPLFWSSI